MKINGKHYRSIWLHPANDKIVQIIDQRWLPHKVVVEDLKTVDDVCVAIHDMWLRGAPLIGAAGAWGIYFSTFEIGSIQNMQSHFEAVYQKLLSTRPTAINLKWALDKMMQVITGAESVQEARQISKNTAQWICDQDTEINYKIGQHGLKLIQEIAAKKDGEPVNILTHCNAGWIATVDWGTATSPIYQAYDKGINVHVWVDETRPRNQGAQLTAWELNEHGVPHTLIVDNAGGHLMQRGMVDMVIIGSDRTTIKGDVGNKIGSYLKALAAYDNNIPFYVALPSTTIDWNITDAINEIPIEERNQNEVKYVQGLVDGEIKSVLICPDDTPACNYAFDITPAKYVTGLITERGICKANEEGILSLFPEKAAEISA